MSNSFNWALISMLPDNLREFLVAKIHVTCPAYFTEKDIIWDSHTTNNQKETK
jgi:hypothetical protein